MRSAVQCSAVWNKHDYRKKTIEGTPKRTLGETIRNKSKRATTVSDPRTGADGKPVDKAIEWYPGEVNQLINPQMDEHPVFIGSSIRLLQLFNEQRLQMKLQKLSKNPHCWRKHDQWPLM